MRTYYYVDTENVSSANYCDVIHKLSVNDTLFLFSSPNSRQVNVNQLHLVVQSVCNLEIIPCNVGTPNAMDFVLCTKLGEMCHRSPKSRHIIISKDKGYTPAIQYWISQGINVFQYTRICDVLKEDMDIKRNAVSSINSKVVSVSEKPKLACI